MTKKETVIRVTYKNGVIVNIFANGDIEKLIIVLKKDEDVQNVEKTNIK